MGLLYRLLKQYILGPYTKMMGAKTLLLLLLFTSSCVSLRILRNTLSSSEPSPYSVARSLNARDDVDVSDLTVCLRFRLERLARVENTVGRLLYIGDFETSEELGRQSFSLMWIDIKYPHNFFGFGDERTDNSRNSYLIKNPVTKR